MDDVIQIETITEKDAATLLLFYFFLLLPPPPPPISLSTRLLDKRLAHSSSWQLLVVPPCLCHTHTRPICQWCGSGGDAHLPPTKKEKNKFISVDGERYRQLRPRARELIDQEANENLVGTCGSILMTTRISNERGNFFFCLAQGFFLLQSLGCENSLTKPFFENVRQPAVKAGRQAGSHAYCPYVLTSHLIDKI